MSDVEQLYNRQFKPDEQETLLDIINARRDVRGNNFINKAIEEENLTLLFQAANAAPSVGLSQPWEFIVIKDPGIKQQVFENSMAEKRNAGSDFSTSKKSIYRDMKLEGILEAPINLAVYYNPPHQKIIGNNTMPETGEYSVVCAIQNMWLMARSLNIGMGWVSIISPEKINQLLSVPPHFKLIGYLCLGYTKEFLEIPEFEKTKWAARKNFSSSISYDKYQEHAHHK